jgi:hypothetical protein
VIDHAIARIVAVLEGSPFADQAAAVNAAYGAPLIPGALADVIEWESPQVARFPCARIGAPRTVYAVVKGAEKRAEHTIEVTILDRDADRATLMARIRRLARAAELAIETTARLGGSTTVADYVVTEIDYAAGMEGRAWIAAATLDVVAVESVGRSAA